MARWSSPVYGASLSRRKSWVQIPYGSLTVGSVNGKPIVSKTMTRGSNPLPTAIFFDSDTGGRGKPSANLLHLPARSATNVNGRVWYIVIIGGLYFVA